MNDKQALSFIFYCNFVHLYGMSTDQKYMQRALGLAKLGGAYTYPNPLVGAVIVHNDTIIGEGYHQVCGEAHAEVNAVNSVQDKSLLAESTIYVTLEPCSHYGKTPPCADLLVHHNFKRVVIATVDPFAQVNGAGISRLKNAGIEVETGILEEEARLQNRRFFTFHQKKRPYIVLKWAESQDGFMDNTDPSRTVSWITGPESKVLVHQQRSEEASILVGWKTIQNDNPSLTVRETSGKDPLRIIIDPHLKAAPDSLIYTDGKPVVILNEVKEEKAGAIHYYKVGSLSPTSVCEALYQLGQLSVYIEGGAYTLQSFIDSGLWDEAYQFIGPVKFGKGTIAPIIKKAPDTSQMINQDQLFFYKHQK